MSSNRGLGQLCLSMFYTLKKIHNHRFDLPRACWHTVCTPMHLKAASQETGRELLAPLKRHQLISLSMDKECREGNLVVPAAAQLLGIRLVSGHEAAELQTQQSLQYALRAHTKALRTASVLDLPAKPCLPHAPSSVGVGLLTCTCSVTVLTTERLKG